MVLATPVVADAGAKGRQHARIMSDILHKVSLAWLLLPWCPEPPEVWHVSIFSCVVAGGLQPGHTIGYLLSVKRVAFIARLNLS